jgi:HAAS domain-containing protein
MNASGQSQSTDPRVVSYLDALNRALYGLPDSVHAEVYGEIRQHIDDELAQRPGDSTAIPEVLDRLGDPQEIAREAGAYPAPMPPPQRPSRVHEIFAVILLAIGGFVAGFGWIVGVVLLWTSNRFTRADKVIGTLLVPGGFFASLLVLGFGLVGTTTEESCSTGPSSPQVHGIKIPHTEATSYLTRSVTTTCTGGHSAVFTVVVIAVALVVLLGPLYTVIRLSRRVAAM